MTYDEFKEGVLSLEEKCPKEWRKGQSIFNIIDSEYGVARKVQFIDGIDCFYDDSQIEDFLKHCYYYVVQEIK